MNDPTRQRALGAILANAVLRWQTLVTLAVTAILFLFVPLPLPFWQPWFWLVAGLIAEGALVYSVLKDPNAASEAVAREFDSKFDLSRIRNLSSRDRLQKAMEYRRNMLTLAQRHDGAMRTQLTQTVADINDWIEQMYNLALHVDDFESNRLVENDRRAVPQQLERARVRLQRETDPAVRSDLENQIKQFEQQLTNLEATANGIKRAEIQLESTLSSLGTIYAQMSLLGAKDVDSARAQRLRVEIQDEVAGLQDTITAMDDVQSQRLQVR